MSTRIAISVLFAALALSATPCAGQPIGVVIVELKQAVELMRPVVTVGDIAEISGGDVITRRKIAALDLDVAPTKRSATIPRLQVETRILLAGIRARNFRVLGTNQVLLRPWNRAAATTDLIGLLLPEIAARLDADPADVDLKLARPLDELTIETGIGVSVRPSFPARVRPGRLSLKVGIYRGDELAETRVVSLDVRLSRTVYVATRPLSRGTVLSPDDVTSERKFVDGRQFESVAKEFDGKELSRAVSAGQILLRTDLRAPRPKRPEYVVQSRDVVEVVARRRSLRVRLSGMVALQRGAVGDTIRVQYPNSRKVLSARVVDSGLVEIRL